MELIKLLSILKKNWKKILLGGLVLSALFYAGSVAYPTKYRAKVSVYVQKIPEAPQRGDYTYDGYYTLKAAEGYTDTVVGLLQSSDIIRRALEIAQLPTDAMKVNYFAKKIKVEKNAPQLIDLSVTLRGRELSLTLVSAVVQAAQESTRVLNQEGISTLRINLVNKDPLVLKVKPSKELNALVGFAVGVFLMSLGVFLSQYLKENLKNGRS